MSQDAMNEALRLALEALEQDCDWNVRANAARALREACSAALAEQDAEPSERAVDVAKMILSDCGCSTDNETLLMRVACRISWVMDQKPTFCGYCGGNDEYPQDHCMDCTKPALAEQEVEQEPVAWMDDDGHLEWNRKSWMDDRYFPVYRRPPRREWRGLTEPEMHTLDWPNSWQYDDVRAFCESVEAKLREMNS